MLLGLEKKYFSFYTDIGQLRNLFSPIALLLEKPNKKNNSKEKAAIQCEK